MGLPDVPRLLDVRYALRAQSYERLAASAAGDRLVVRVADRRGRAWLLRMHQAGTPVPDRLAGCGATSVRALLTTRAATLRFLESRGYPAPRVRAATDGSLVVDASGWSMLVTTFLAGTVPRPTSPMLRRIGALVGRLHALEPGGTGPEPGASQWSQPRSSRAALSRLLRASRSVPASWRPTLRGYRDALDPFLAPSRLPVCVIHTDVWIGNVVRRTRNALALVDWDESGLGPAVLDLGRLLLAAHWDLTGPERIARLNDRRIRAVIDGYRQARMPTPLEIQWLPDALRFAVAFHASNQFAWLRRREWTPARERACVYVRDWYRACDAIARAAQRRLAAYSSSRS